MTISPFLPLNPDGQRAGRLLFLKDESGVESHVYINGYVGYSGHGADIEEFVKIGAQISFVGIASERFTGYRLRVRDRSEITLTGSDTAVVNAVPSAHVTKLNGNKNDLTITVAETFSDGTVNVVTRTFSIINNAAGEYAVGTYTVYVDTKGNDQIRACYIVE